MAFVGYLHPGYAQTLSEFGTPVGLPRSGAWFLKRAIPGSGDLDGIGCYPYLACGDWSALASDLEALGDELVTFAAAPDPFGEYTAALLDRAFPDLVVHFKDHYVADLSRPLEEIVSKHHRRIVEKASRGVQVECRSEPLGFLDDFLELYDATLQRFGAKGIRTYSRLSIAKQFALPGCFVSLARHDGIPIAAHVQFLCDGVVYAHFGCASPRANTLGADYALYDAEIRYFHDKALWIDWGGHAGITRAENGLDNFKQGWSTGTLPAYFCGRILDRERYGRLARERGVEGTSYFPAYREGEFG